MSKRRFVLYSFSKLLFYSYFQVIFLGEGLEDWQRCWSALQRLQPSISTQSNSWDCQQQRIIFKLNLESAENGVRSGSKTVWPSSYCPATRGCGWVVQTFPVGFWRSASVQEALLEFTAAAHSPVRGCILLVRKIKLAFLLVYTATAGHRCTVWTSTDKLKEDVLQLWPQTKQQSQKQRWMSEKYKW